MTTKKRRLRKGRPTKLSATQLVAVIEKFERVGLRALGWADGKADQTGYLDSIGPLEGVLITIRELRVARRFPKRA